MKGLSIVKYIKELPKEEDSKAFNCSTGSFALETFSKNTGQYPKELDNLSILLYLQKISTGSDIFNMPFPDKIFLPILFMIKVNTFFCSLIFY